MEVMEMIKMVMYLVWILVGITIVGSTIYYITLCHPMMKQYKNMLTDMHSQLKEEA